MGTKVRRHIP